MLIRTFLVCLGLAGHLAAQSELDKVYDNIIGFYTARDADTADPYLAPALAALEHTVRAYIDSLGPDGRWRDISYDGVYEYRGHYGRIVSLAQAYLTRGQAFYDDPALKDRIDSCFHYISTRVYDGCDKSYGGWWFWDIGLPQSLSLALLLMKGRMDPGRYRHQTTALEYCLDGPPDGGGVNLLWECRNHLHYAVAESLPTRLDTVRQHLVNECNFTYEIKEDYSYWFHGRQLYTGGYGGSFAYEAAYYLMYVKGTVYELPEANLRIFADYVAEGPRWGLYHNYYDPSVISREVTRAFATGRTGLYALLILGNVPNHRQPDCVASARRMLQTWSGDFPVEIAPLVGPAAASSVGPAWPAGHKYYWVSDYAVHRRPDYYLSVKLLSNRMLSGEYGGTGGEGAKSWHLSDGMTYIVRTGDEYYTNDVWPCLDWYRLPGTTVERKDRAPGEGLGFGSRSFVGGVHDGRNGVAVMDFKANESALSAQKSYFFFENAMVCLGTSVRCTTANRVETILNQRPLPGAGALLAGEGGLQVTDSAYTDTLQGRAWLWCDSVGYYFPDTSQRIAVKRAFQSGRWYDLNDYYGTTDVHTNPILTLWINHGEQPASRAYSYAVLMNVDAPDMHAYAAERPLTILERSDRIHAVHDSRTRATGIVFWQADSLDLASADQPCALYYGTDDTFFYLAVSNPEHDARTVTVTLDTLFEWWNLPPEMSLDTAGGITALAVSTDAGKSYQCVLGPDLVIPRVAGVSAAADTAIVVTFDEPVRRGPAQTTGHYQLSGGATVRQAVLAAAPWTVVLTCSPLNPDSLYTITITGITDSSVLANRMAPHVQTFTWCPGLVAYWSFNGEDKDLARDVSGRGHDGAISGAARVSGVRGGALSFDGANDYVRVPHRADLTGFTQMSITAWVHPREAGTAQHGDGLVHKGDGSGGNGEDYEFNFHDNYTVHFSPRRSGGWVCWLPCGPLAPNAWNFVAATFDADSARMYQDGVPCTSIAAGGTVQSGTSDLLLGRGGNGLARYFNGLLDEVRIYDRALTADQVRRLHSADAVSVVLSAFYAEATDSAITLYWSAASQERNAGWNLYRRTGEAGDFYPVNGSLIPGHGTTGQPRAYGFTDPDKPDTAVVVYYYLEQIDSSGVRSYSAVISLTITPQAVAIGREGPEVFPGVEVEIIPNPFCGTAVIRVRGGRPHQRILLDVCRTTGEVIRTMPVRPDRPVRWDGTDRGGCPVPPGLYLMNIADGQGISRRYRVVRLSGN